MKSILTLVFIGMIAVAASANTGPNPGRVFAWDFTNGLSQPWETIGGRWEVRDGCLRQTDPGPDDPKKAIIVTGDAEDWSTDVVVTAKLRIDSWEGDSDSRVGICVCSDRGDGHGLNLVFHRGRLQFLHDFVAWGDGCDFVYETGKWYWMKLSKSGEEICGKAWADSSPEPAEWMITWTDYDDTVTGYPGLNGGSKGSASLSFAQFQVERLTSSERKKSLEGTDVRLDGTWQACPEPLTCIGESGLARVQSASDGWIPAQVPGEIHLDLVKAGKMPDPAVGLNMPQCRWTKTNSWWYRTSFELEAGFQRFERQRLVFDGLDLYAQVFVNGKLAGESADAFVPAVFEVKPFLRPGRNELVVRLTEGSELAPRDLGKSPATFMWPGRIWLRKPQFEWGWDWVDGLPNIGIWRSVRLEGRRYAVLHDLRMDTLRQGNQVSLEMEAVLENLNSAKLRACTLDLEIRPPDGGTTVTRHYAVDAPPGRMPIRDVIEIPDAKLWWPNGMGDQPLYQIVARVLDGSGVATSDRREFSIGLRTIEIDRQRLAQGTRFCFRVNGQDVFCRGGNLGPQDAILARVSDAKYQTLVAEAKNAHMNMFRLNGVSEFEGPAFYEACDRAGILIWHDFMFACSPYPEDNSSFMATVQAEITSAVRMLRHHPSIALWSGNNECYAGCKKLFQQTLPDLCMKLDPKRPYWPGSPCGGNLSGDTHGWYCAFMTPMDIASEFRVRFVSEYGILGPCHLDSIREYLGTEEVTRGTPAWKFHTQDWERANDYVSKGIQANYLNPASLTVPEWVDYGQMWQAIIQGHMMEALRFQKNDLKNDCQGALIWSYTDCFGETGWAILDYYMRRKAAYYWFRRAAAPLKVIVRQLNGHLITRLVNDTLEPANVTVDLGWWRLDGTEKVVVSYPVDVQANGMVEVASAKTPTASERDPRQWLYAAVLRGRDGVAMDQSVWLERPYRELALEKPAIKAVPIADNWLEISSPVFAHAVHTEDHGHEVLSDNWFDLLPGVPVRVRLAPGIEPASIHFKTLGSPNDN